MKPLFLLFTIVFLKAIGGHGQTANTRTIKQADSLFYSGNYESAKIAYLALKKQEHNDFNDHITAQLEVSERCIGYLKAIEELSKDPTSAKAKLVVCEKILNINPKDPSVQNVVMESYWQEADRHYRQLEFQKSAEILKKIMEFPQNQLYAKSKELLDSCNYFSEKLMTGFNVMEVESEAVYASGLPGIRAVIANNMEYPAKALKDKVSGKVWVSYVVGENGKVIPDMVQVERGIGSGCDEEAMRLVKMMNNWKPAIKWNKPVRFRSTILIQFVLSK
jgi:Gram-negative bacterial TonB protein C-terminal